MQTEAELLAEKKCVAHLTGDVSISVNKFLFFVYEPVYVSPFNAKETNILN